MAIGLTQSLSSLLQRTTLDDHEEILKLCNTILKKSKGDLDTQHIKAVALLKLDCYDDAARLFQDAGKGLQEEAAIEYAYTLYKVGKLKEAAAVASDVEGQRPARHIEAQALYRAEHFSKAAQLYQDLSKGGVSSEAHDIRINSGAVDAQLQWAGWKDQAQYKKPGREDLEAFETAYNAACGSIARGELAQAEILLKRAKELCKYSEELSDDEKSAELLPITVQQLYVLERLGRTSDAEKIAAEIRIADIPDLSTRKIALNNTLISSPESANPFIAHSRFSSTPEIPESDNLFAFQSRPLTSNARSLDLQAFKYDGVAESTARAIANQAMPTTLPHITSLSVLNAAAHARNMNGKAALRLVLPELEKRPNDVGMIATLLQMYVLTNNMTAATTLLKSFLDRLDSSASENDQDVRFSPGLVGTLVALYKTQGLKSQIKQELAKAANYWRHKSKPPKSLLQAAGTALLESSDLDDISAAGEIFTKLHEQNPDEKMAIAGYVASNAIQHPQSVKSEVEKLTPILDLIKNVDVDALEGAGIPQSSNALAIAQQRSSRKRAGPDSDRPKAKRIRKSRLPKDFESGKKADPERWLPLRERSTYRPKGKKKGKKDGGDRTQGGVVAEDVGVKETLPNKAQTPGVVGGGNKKKKGKGKK